MIKRIRFATAGVGVPLGRFAVIWREAAAGAGHAPAYTRPVRITVGLPVPDVDVMPRHDAVALEWFRDATHLRRFVTWLGTREGRAATEAADWVAANGREQIVVADERIVYGADSLTRHRRDAAETFTAMTLVRRNTRLTLEEFSRRWADIGAGCTHGLGHIQNHPFSRPNDWPYDAVNEVCFDDPADLRAHTSWLRRDPPPDIGVVRASWSLAVAEEVLLTADRPVPLRLPHRTTLTTPL